MSLTESEIFNEFYANADPAQAEPMAAYMKNVCPFLGIPKPKRTALSKEFLRQSKKVITVDWAFVGKCWSLEREFQYLALEYIRVLAHLLSEDDIPKLRELAVTKSWWDTIDCLDRIVGSVALSHPVINDTLLAWSTDDNFWLRRLVIDHQLLRKEQTNTMLLEKILVNNLGQKEFFVNKAIGWSLREYSKTNPDWVRRFIAEHKAGLASLSVREASKYI